MIRGKTWHATLVLFVTLLAPSVAAASGVYALFDLESPSGAPFPSDRFTVPDKTQNTRLRVDLPKSDCVIQVSDCGDIDTLNTLDGFNLQPRLSIPFSGPIDVTTVSSNTVVLIKLGDARRGRGHHHHDHDDDDDDADDDGDRHGRWHRERTIGINQIVWDVATNTLHVESDELLDQHARYALIVTRGVKDMDGRSVRASKEFEHFRHRHSHGFQSYRKALLKGLDKARAAGIHHHDIVAASVFTTQSVTAILEKIRDQIKAATPESADFLLGPGGTRTVYPVSQISRYIFHQQRTANPDKFFNQEPMAALNNLKQSAVGQMAFGKYRSPDYLTPCPPPPPCDPPRLPTPPCDRFIPPVGTRTGIPLAPGTEEIYFNLFLPAETAELPRPAGGWPVVIYGFGTNDTKNNTSLAIATVMAARGLALVTINGVGQGLGGNSQLSVVLDDNADGTADRTVRFSAGGRSSDENGDCNIGTGGLVGMPMPTSEGADGGFTNRRDPRRQTAVDLMQLVRVIEVGVDVDGDGVADLDPSRIYYFGFSHGADHGMMFVATEPLVRAAVLTGGGGNTNALRFSPGNRLGIGRYLGSRMPSLLNAPGISSLDDVPIAEPRFSEQLPLRDGLRLAVGLADGTSQIVQSPVINTVPGAMEIQLVMERTQWVQQAADGTAYAPYLSKSPLKGVPAKPVIVQLARGDQTVPNPGTTALIRSGDLADRATIFRNDKAFAANPTGFPTKNGHNFVIPNPATAQQTAVALAARRQIAEFFASDGVLFSDPDDYIVPAPSQPLFEAPIVGPLPEDLGFIP